MRAKRFVKNLAVLFVTLLIIFIVLEIGMRIIYDKFVEDYSMEMWKYSSKLKVKSENTDLSHIHRPLKSAKLYGVNIEINSDGLRDYEYSKEKSKDAYRIAFVGDSVTLGWGVDFNDTIPKILERRLNREKERDFEVINFGIGNYNTKQELTLLKEKVLDYNPDMVILGYYINDAEPVPVAIQYNLKRHSHLYGFLWNKFQLSLRSFGVSSNYVDYYKGLYEESNPGFSLFKDSLQEFMDVTKENKMELLIVINPELHEIDNYPFEKSNIVVIEIANKNNVPVLDLLPYFKYYKPEELWVSKEDVHPNGVANKIAGEAIYNYIILII